jgi:hypothetical protein
MKTEGKSSRTATSLLLSLAIVTMWLFFVLSLIEAGSPVF